MADNINAEALAISALPETAVTAAAVGRPAVAAGGVDAAAEARRLREFVAKRPQDPAQAVVDRLNKLAPNADPLTQSKESIERNFGVGEFNPKTGEKKQTGMSTPEIERRTSAKAISSGIEAVIKGDPIDLADVAKFELVTKDMDAIFKAQFPHLDDAGRKALYETMLKDPKFIQAITKRYGEVIARRLTGEKEVMDAERQAKQAKEKRTLKENARKRAVRSHTDAVTAQAQFDNPGTAGKGQRLQELINDKLESELDRLTTRRNDLQLLINNPVKAAAVVGFDLGVATTERDGLITQIDDINIKRAERDGLKAEKASLPTRTQQLEEAKEQAEQEYQEAQGDENAAEYAVTEARATRNDAEIQLLRELKGVIGEGVRRQMLENIGEVVTARTEMLDKENAETKDTLDAKLRKDLRMQFYGNRDPGMLDPRKNKVTLNKDAARGAMKILMDVDGVGAEQLLTEALSRQPNRKTEAEIKELLKDREFVDKWTKAYAQEATNVYLQTGGRFTREEYAYIESQPWGESLVSGAIAKNKEVQGVDKVLKENGIKGGILELMKTRKGKGIIAIILALTAGLIMAPVAIGMITGSGGGGAAGAGLALG